MGVYIPNVEMPRGCNSCPMAMEIDNTCSMTMGGCTKDERPPHCPLIEIVRCKDCKHYDTESRTFPCCTDIFGAVRYMEADGFCSKGERRADG